MFKLLNVKMKTQPPTPLNLLDNCFGRSTIIIKGKNGKWYEVEDGNGSNLVWIETGESDKKMREMITKANMQNVTDIVIIEDTTEVWCDNECGDADYI